MAEPLSPTDVSRAITALSLAGWGNTPRSLVERDVQATTETAKVWLGALSLIGVEPQELTAAVQALLVQPGRRFWPSTSEVCDVVRDGRRQMAREQFRRVLAAADDAKALPAPESVRTDEERKQFLLARMRRSGIEVGLRQVRVLHELGQPSRAERQAIAEFEEELRQMAGEEAEA